MSGIVYKFELDREMKKMKKEIEDLKKEIIQLRNQRGET